MRLLVLNYKVAFAGRTKAVATYNAERDIIRIHCTPSYEHEPRPGTHYFLYFPTMLKTVGNHPFSLSSWTIPEKERLSNSIQIQSASTVSEKDQVYPSIRTTEEEVSETDSSQIVAANATQLRFVIRPYKGLTASLRDAIIKTGTGSKEMKILMEGPYGHTYPLLSYDSVLCFIGGSGIASVLPYMQEFLRPQSRKGAGRTKHIHLVWAAKQYSFVRDVLDNELAVAASASARSRVKLDFYITGAGPRAVKGEDALDLDRLGNADTKIFYHRPVVESVLRENVLQTVVGSLAVFVCGPAQLADDARRAAVNAVGNGFDRLGYFEEQFGW
jgi:ferric-chelate reductase